MAHSLWTVTHAADFAKGIRRTLAWFDADPSRKWVDEKVDQEMDEIIAAYKGTGEGQTIDI